MFAQYRSRLRLALLAVICTVGLAASAELAHATSVSLGRSFGCALQADHTVACWGGNAFGELGDGTRSPRRSAQPVAGVRDATDVAAGTIYACAVRLGGTVSCWGTLPWSMSTYERPTDIPGVSDAIAVAAGESEICVLRRAGRVSCAGQHRGPDHPFTTDFREVVGLRGITSLVVSEMRGCTLDRRHRVVCWGLLPEWGGAAVPRDRLVRVHSLDRARSISLPNTHGTCGAFSNGTVQCTRRRERIAQTRRTRAARLHTQRVRGVRDAVGLSDRGPLCIRRKSATVACTPSLSETTAAPGPDVVRALTSVLTVTGNDGATICATTTSGLRCWGDTPTTAATPADAAAVARLSDIVALGATSTSPQICALRSTGRVACWGMGTAGWPGNGRFDASTPFDVPGVEGATRLIPADQGACAQVPTGVVCWGRLGRQPGGAVLARPELAGLNLNAVPGCGLVQTTVRCADYAQPAAAGKTARLRVFDLGGALVPATAVSEGNETSAVCTTGTDGNVRCGTGEELNLIANASGITGIVRNTGSVCGVRPGGGAACWPTGKYDRGRTAPYGEARDVPGLEGAVQIAVSDLAMCGRLHDGDVSCVNADSTTARLGLRDASQLVAGAMSTCALRSDGTARCWGYGDSIGDGPAPNGHGAARIPAPVAGFDGRG